jgi:hypothetical protein
MTKEVLKTTKSVPVQIKIITGADAIGKAIASLAKRGKAFDKDVHIAAMSCLIHADKHGDITLANKLIDALPASQRKNALRDWFLAFGKFNYDQQNKTFTFNGAVQTQEAEAMSTPFWEFKPEAAYVPFNAIAFLNSAIKRVENAAAKGEAVPVELVKGLPALLATITKADVLAA